MTALEQATIIRKRSYQRHSDLSAILVILQRYGTLKIQGENVDVDVAILKVGEVFLSWD